MIIDHMGNSKWYECLHPRFKAAFDFIRNSDLSSMEAGRYEIDGDNIFALVQVYDTKDVADKFFETHKNYIDIQYIISGCEKMGYTSKDDLTVTDAYDPEKDFEKYAHSRMGYVLLDEGSYAVFFPSDPHMPGCSPEDGKPENVKKLVLKILM